MRDSRQTYTEDLIIRFSIRIPIKINVINKKIVDFPLH